MNTETDKKDAVGQSASNVGLGAPLPSRETYKALYLRLKNTMQQWHEQAIEKGYDGVSEVLAVAPNIKPPTRKLRVAYRDQSCVGAFARARRI